MKGEIDNSVIMGEDFNTLMMGRTTGQKLN